MDKVYGGKTFMGREIYILKTNANGVNTIIKVSQSYNPKYGDFRIERSITCKSFYQAMVTAHDWNMELYELQQKFLKEHRKGGK